MSVLVVEKYNVDRLKEARERLRACTENELCQHKECDFYVDYEDMKELVKLLDEIMPK